MPANEAMRRIARQRKGFQQTEAASRLGIDQSLLSRIENGLVVQRDEIILRAETANELPRSLFFLTDPIYGALLSVHPTWRRKADVTVREMDAIVAGLNIRVTHLRRFPDGAEYANDLPRLDIEVAPGKRSQALLAM